MEVIKKEFKLSAGSVDEISDLITEFCMSVKTEKKDMLRYRLSVEECLLHWLSRGDEGHAVTVSLGRRLMVPYIRLEESGEASNPYADINGEYGTFSDSILVSLNLSPEYSYEKGANVVSYRLKRKSPGQITRLCSVIAAAVIVGLLGMVVLPAGIREAALDGLIMPLYRTFFSLLSCIAGPMIFLSVAWGIYGIGDAATLGKVGKTMMAKYAGVTFLAAMLATVFFPILGPGLSDGSGGSTQLASITELILGIFPPNIVEPFQTNNTLQIIFLAFVVGLALLFLSHQTRTVAQTIEQANLLVQFLMGIISKFVPFVILLVIINMMWSGTIAALSSVWKFLLALIAGLVLCEVIVFMYTSTKLHVRIPVLIRKSMPTYLICLATASSAAAFGTIAETCEKRFGIEKSLVRFGIPLGMVMCKPCTAINNILLVFFFASRFDVECSAGWIISAVIVSFMLAIAMPPIPGGATIMYSMLYTQMGIPQEALAITLAIDAVSDFVITSTAMPTLQLVLVNVASKLGMIDEKTLRSADAD